MRQDANMIDLDLIKSQISLPQVLAICGIPYDGKNIVCLWHDDRDPSMQVFNDHAFCHACRKWADIFSFVMKKERMNLERAVQWLMERKGILPEQVIQKAPVEYKGPMPLNIIDYWHDQLDEERRQYLYNRLLLPETLEEYRIGFRPDYNAYTIPFWEHIPGKSDVIALQYRDASGKKDARKYWWEPGRYKPCLFNQHLINTELNVLLFGTLDALLGAQDGLPLLSASGLNTFANANKAESYVLRELLQDTRQKIVLPDGTLVEFEAATRVTNTIGGEIKYFPYYVPKDYTDYRMAGYTKEQFITEVLEMEVSQVPVLSFYGEEGF